MKVHWKYFGRALWLNLFVLSVAMSGIYGLNRDTARKILLMFAVSILFAAVASLYAGRSRNCGNSAAQR